MRTGEHFYNSACQPKFRIDLIEIVLCGSSPGFSFYCAWWQGEGEREGREREREREGERSCLMKLLRGVVHTHPLSHTRRI